MVVFREGVIVFMTQLPSGTSMSVKQFDVEGALLLIRLLLQVLHLLPHLLPVSHRQCVTVQGHCKPDESTGLGKYHRLPAGPHGLLVWRTHHRQE